MAELKHLHSAWDVDRFIVLEEEKVIAIRFSAHEVPVPGQLQLNMDTELMDATLVKVAPKLRNFCTIYAVDITEVPQFNTMYDFENDDNDPFALMFFFQNKHIKVDTGTGNNNKITFPITEPQDIIDIVTAVYIAGKRGKGIAESPKSFAHARRKR